MENIKKIRASFSLFKKNNKKIMKIFIYLMGFCLLGIGIINSTNPSTGIYGLIKLLEYVFLFSYTANNFRKLNKTIIFLTFIIGILFESFLAITQYVNQGSLGGLLYFLGERSFNSQTPGIANASINGQLFLRPYATFSHPNVLAGYLLVGMLVIIFFARQKFLKQQNTFAFLTLAIGSGGLFLSMSRIVIIVWGASILFMFTHSFWKKTRMGLTKKRNLQLLVNRSLLLLLLIITLFFLTFPIGLRIFQFSFSDEALIQRVMLIRDSLVMFGSNPVFGVGINNFLVNLPAVQKLSKEVLYIQPVHNIYLLVLSQTGVIGFALLIYLLTKTYKKVKQTVNIELLTLFFSILLLGLFDHYFLTLQQGQILFAIIFGLFWSKPRIT
jgi:O-antigen ligase